MSGIAGLLRFDGAPVSPRELGRAANALRAHGPDRACTAISGPAGLAHVLMRMTPEDSFDRQPWRGASGAIITADLRLDNRDDLLALIGVPPADALSWPDARILLQAWEQLGDAIWPRLRGPFAAAIWDPRNNVLRLVRDHLGLHVVMWTKTEHVFAFATMPTGLFAFDGVTSAFNEEKFADFLVLNHADHATTVYRHVFRLPPAHLAEVTPDGRMSLRRYWSPDEIAPVRLANDGAYAEGLRACLDRAVRRQLRSAHPVGCYLSGGLDSSSVAVLAARALAESGRRLSAFTQVPREGFDGPVPEGRYADECPYVEAIAALSGNIDVTHVRNDACDDFADLERLFLFLEGPVRNPSNLGWMLAIPRLARAQGTRVLLGGAYGNTSISWSGWSQAVDHLLRGRLITAWRQWRQFYRASPDSRWVSLRKLLLDPLLPCSLGDWIDRRHRGSVARWQEHSVIRPDYAAVMGIEARARDVGHDFLYRFRPGERFDSLTPIDYLGDFNAAVKAMTGVEERDPTADIDVVSYCLGVPPEQFLAENVDRSLIRRAMWGLIPEEVLTNRLSGLQSADWYEKLEKRRDDLAREIDTLAASPLVSKAIDLDRLRGALATWPAGDWHTYKVIQEYHLALTRGLAAAHFLRWVEAANR
ncbi:asparagine synthase-related protein [Bradyrhizobium prioriisuperbiae]|uniref:asparagine synthase-related protein n=1 Tax=Bradyrhizobium prioriisuperbiae TaxID=2854389 RepID=UPI0028E4270D|nr:asparagine synthase-related protein [Bradyrhizobium prioritasuperba]